MRRKRRKNSLFIVIFLVISLLLVVFILNYITSKIWFNSKNIDEKSVSIIDSWNVRNEINKNLNDTKSLYSIWDEINYLEWNLVDTEIKWLKYYFVFQTKKWKFYLVSKNIDLNKYLWRDIVIKGKIEDKKWNMYIIQVTEVFSNDDVEEKNPYVYYYWDKWFYIDFSSNTWYYSYLDENNNVVIAKREKVDIVLSGNNSSGYNQIFTWYKKRDIYLSIKWFLCNNKWNFFVNCKKQEEFAKSAYADNFISANNIHYYKIPESNQWFWTALDYFWWYYFSPKDDDTLIKFSDYIYPITKDKIKERIIGNIKDICVESDRKIESIKDISVLNSWWNIIIDILGKDNSLNDLNCIFKLSFKKDTIVTQDVKLIYKIDSFKKENNIQYDINDNYTWLVASFKAWFTLYVPYVKLFYGQVDLDSDNLWVNGILCDIQVNISDKIENLVNYPKIKIYRCKSSIDENNIKKLFSNDIVKKVDNYYFIFKMLDNNWKDIANNIKVVIK